MGDLDIALPKNMWKMDLARTGEYCLNKTRNGKVDRRNAIEVIIVGAGVAGSALAYTLGKEGRRVRVIERDLNQPDRIVGELLQLGGYLKLLELGFQDSVHEIDAQRVFSYVLYKNRKNTRLSYTLKHFQSDVAGMSFHNGRFIQRMRHKAASLPNIEQGTMTSLIEENGTIKGVQYKTKGGRESSAYICSPYYIVCDDCFSNLRYPLCDLKVNVASYFVSLALENCKLLLVSKALSYANYGHVILAYPSPILFYPISNTEIRCLVDVPGQKVPSLSNGEMAIYLKTVVAPQVVFILTIDQGNIRTMPNRSMHVAPHPKPGALSMGGMIVALFDIVVLKDLLRPLYDLHDASALCVYLESFYTLRKPVVSTINTLVGALYKVFSASPDPARKEMRQACFDYWSLEGIFSNGLISLLSGLNPRPISLVLHFFVVAINGVERLLLPFSSPKSPKRIWTGARLISGATSIIFPIIKAEGIRQMFFPITMPAYYRVPPVD
ncbi:hypothetical protein E1A91_D01G212100v1 [Gossypium mustelinum]|uniref:Squalene monooxygenase n=1 Tax=Gossypium mustelinum TaxID=34275 RepID=A0A5D2WAD7_GOSMU|nr:hypothetical protein E1A91_D01G212100v1 [Gossypium mustelinum]